MNKLDYTECRIYLYIYIYIYMKICYNPNILPMTIPDSMITYAIIITLTLN